MIPLKLRLRNFMCYRDNVPPLSLEGVHVACLCGDNGSGKSALLDAMTWALWGKSRAESDDDLVHEGQGDMEVDLEFSAQSLPYRVLRKHAKGPAGRSGSTLLTLQTGANGNYTDISGNTKTETQQKLIDILRLDYKTFRNSAYLAQGKANEFTLADPAERKKVLAAILDLSQYDELSERAKAQAVEKNNMASRLEDLIARMDSELSSKQQNLADLAQLEVLLADVETARVAAEATMTGLMQQYQSLEIKRSQLKDLESHQPQLREDLSRWAKRFTDINQQIAEYEKMEAERATIKEGYELFSRLDSENRTFNEKAQRLLGLASNISRLEMAVERAQNELVSEHRALQKKLEGLQKLVDSIPKLESDLSEVQAELKALGTLEESLTDKRRSTITLVTQIENLRSGAERLSAEAKQLENKLNLLSAHGAKCPLCETEL
ncbi:MAG TPA: SMC family ATPase, partial [Dehalococcoidia bacterium]|nr:SMC family ATPase [Dehalococcoidia bacterium]